MSAHAVTVHDRWSTPAFDLEPVARRTGPFVRREFLDAWWRHRGGGGDLQLLDSGTGLVPLCHRDGVVRFVGEADLVDYHSPLGSGTDELIATFVQSLDDGTRLEFGNLPAEAADTVARGLTGTGLSVKPVRRAVAAVLDLPDSFDDWVASLAGKQRHEVRRKLRRFEAAGSSPRLERWDGPRAVATFCNIHRKAGGDKGRFMTDDMEAYFSSLSELAGGVVDVLPGSSGSPVAAAFGFEDDDGYYLYNSGYEPGAAHLSPGIVMLTALIRKATSSGKQFFDFLKGNEKYKFRLGARARPLYEIRAVAGRSP